MPIAGPRMRGARGPGGMLYGGWRYDKCLWYDKSIEVDRTATYTHSLTHSLKEKEVKVHTMRNYKAITVTITPEQYTVITKAGKASKEGASSVVRSLLDASMPVLKDLAVLADCIEEARKEQDSKMKAMEQLALQNLEESREVAKVASGMFHQFVEGMIELGAGTGGQPPSPVTRGSGNTK